MQTVDVADGIETEIVAEQVPLIGGRVRRLRKARQWSQGVLADKAGIEQAALSRIELGRTQPRTDTIKKLAKAFGVPTGELLDGGPREGLAGSIMEAGAPAADGFVPAESDVARARQFLVTWRNAGSDEERRELMRCYLAVTSRGFDGAMNHVGPRPAA